jgi:hypothetical protein
MGVRNVALLGERAGGGTAWTHTCRTRAHSTSPLAPVLASPSTRRLTPSSAPRPAAIGLLMANYAGAVGLALTYSAAFNVPLMAGSHAILGCVLMLRCASAGPRGASGRAVHRVTCVRRRGGVACRVLTALPAGVLPRRALRLHAANYSREAVASFYRWIWNLFYAEYVLLPFL